MTCREYLIKEGYADTSKELEEKAKDTGEIQKFITNEEFSEGMWEPKDIYEITWYIHPDGRVTHTKKQIL
jgi:hypothetical protein